MGAWAARRRLNVTRRRVKLGEEGDSRPSDRKVRGADGPDRRSVAFLGSELAERLNPRGVVDRSVGP